MRFTTTSLDDLATAILGTQLSPLDRVVLSVLRNARGIFSRGMTRREVFVSVHAAVRSALGDRLARCIGVRDVAVSLTNLRRLGLVIQRDGAWRVAALARRKAVA